MTALSRRTWAIAAAFVAVALTLGVALGRPMYSLIAGLAVAGGFVAFQRSRTRRTQASSSVRWSQPGASRPDPTLEVREMSESMIAKGATGEIYFDGRQVVIRRGGGLLTQARGGLTGEKSFPIEAITSVQWQDASTLASGFIKFLTGGSGPIQGSFGTPAVSVAVNDPDTVVFKKKSQADFVRLREAVEAARRNAGRPSPDSAPPAPADIPDQLVKLGALRDSGVITEEEFAAKKADLLSRM